MSCKLICEKGVLHKDEFLDLICMNEDCVQQGRILNCVVCIEEEHRGHELLHITKFINLYKHQIDQLNSQLRNLDVQASNAQTQLNYQEFNYDNLQERLQQLQVQLSETIQLLNNKVSIINSNKQIQNEYLPDVDTIVQNINREEKVFQLIQAVLSKLVLEKTTKKFKLRESQLLGQALPQSESKNINIEKIKLLVKQIEWAFSQYNGNLSIQADSQKLQSSSNFRKSNSSATNRQSQSQQNFYMQERLQISPTNLYQNSVDNVSQSRTLSQFYLLRGSSSQKIQVDRAYSLKRNVISKYEFSQEYKADGIELSQQLRLATLKKDLEKRFIVIQPPVYGSDITKESEIHFRIKNLKNTNSRYPLAIGLCSLQKLKQNNFIFNGCPEQMRMINTKVQNHGCYLLNAFGVIRSVNETQDLTNPKPSMRFQSGTELIMLFKPFHKQLIIKRINEVQNKIFNLLKTKKEQQISTFIQLNLQQGEPLYACVRFGDLLDEVQIM